MFLFQFFPKIWKDQVFWLQQETKDFINGDNYSQPMSRNEEMTFPSSLSMAHSYFVAGQGSPEVSQPAMMVAGSVWMSL